MTLFLVLGVSAVLIILAGLFGMAGRTYFALLVPPSLYSLWMWPHCPAEPQHYWGSCILGVVGRLFMLMIGPFVLDDDPPPNPYPGILLIALAIIVVWTVIVFAFKRYRKSVSRVI